MLTPRKKSLKYGDITTLIVNALSCVISITIITLWLIAIDVNSKHGSFSWLNKISYDEHLVIIGLLMIAVTIAITASLVSITNLVYNFSVYKGVHVGAVRAMNQNEPLISRLKGGIKSLYGSIAVVLLIIQYCTTGIGHVVSTRFITQKKCENARVIGIRQCI